MKILLVIHGYPRRYNAGSEIYTQGLAHTLADQHQVHVFTRQENSVLPEYKVEKEQDPTDSRISLHVINLARTRDRYRNAEVDRHFGELLDQIKPDIIHVGHLNHLSTSLVLEAHRRSIPIIFTLHDYWLMCPRGQFIQMYPQDHADIWTVCERQEDHECAKRCYARYFSGDPEDETIDIAYWTNWVQRRMAHIRRVCATVDLFIAPSHYLKTRFQDDFGVAKEKLVYLDYGFHRERLEKRSRASGEPFTFGYIGTHTPAKGIHHLIEAFGRLSGKACLRIWGRNRGLHTEGLRALARTLPDDVRDRIEWMGEYRNQDIVSRVFNHCDAIVVPSIWAENSPLAIQEALQVRIPVITADYGGMAEYIHHEVNGLLFPHRDPHGLAGQMQRYVDEPGYAYHLGSRGYLQSEDGNIPGFDQHAEIVTDFYRQVLGKRKK